MIHLFVLYVGFAKDVATVDQRIIIIVVGVLVDVVIVANNKRFVHHCSVDKDENAKDTMNHILWMFTLRLEIQ